MNLLLSGAAELGLELSPEQMAQFETYYRELVDWNHRQNLTSITGSDEAQVKHFLDSLTITLAKENLNNTHVIDIGSGAGLPGLPLKIAFSEMELTLLEATTKKIAFLNHIKESLKLEKLTVVNGRAEEAAHQNLYREAFDVVLCRAVARLDVLAELALPFARLGGCLIAQKKGDINIELDEAARAINLMGGRLREVKKVNTTGLEDRRLLVIIDKVALAPETYPRRPGIPAKKPLR